MEVNEALLYHKIGERLKQRRSEVGLTQTQLARTIGVLRTSIANIEVGRQKAPLHVLYKLCTVLEIEVVTILPSNAEIMQPTTIPVNIDGVMRAVPPKTAESLKQLLAE